MKKKILMVAGLMVGVVQAATYYVSPNGTNGDGLSWETAKVTIQSAVNAATSHDTILVANGNYGFIMTTNKLITIRSVNGATATFIDGTSSNRCATMIASSSAMTPQTNTVLIGFTLRNGSAQSTTAFGASGGGAYGGILYDCLLTNNTTTGSGGAANRSILYNCTVAGNKAPGAQGECGGAMNSTLYTCTVSGNTAGWRGGGTMNSTLHNCVVSGNVAGDKGGGAYLDTLYSCLVISNTATNQGGGTYDCELLNCTVAGNRVTSTINQGGLAGGTYNNTNKGTVRNCIVWGNTVANVTNNTFGSTILYTCTTSPTVSGTGNISTNPMFRNPTTRDYRLQEDSQCIHAGWPGWVLLQPAMTRDLDGNARLYEGKVDIGAYQFWFIRYTTTTPVPVPYLWLDEWKQNIADYEDFAFSQGANGYRLWESYVAGLIPTDVRSKFLITNFVLNAASQVTALDWTPNRSDRTYKVLGKTNLTDKAWHSPTNHATKYFKVNVGM